MATLLGRGELSTKYRVIRNQIFEFLDVRSFAAIQELLQDRRRRQEVVNGIHDHWIDPAAGKWTYTYHERLFASYNFV